MTEGETGEERGRRGGESEADGEWSQVRVTVSQKRLMFTTQVSEGEHKRCAGV